jgi:hypothetical protein
VISSVRRAARSLAATLLLVMISTGPAAADDPGSAPVVELEPAVADAPEAGVSFEEVGAMTLDLLVLRPLGAAATVGGCGVFLITAPLVAASWGVGAAWDTFVLAPGEYTFQRPLGEF